MKFGFSKKDITPKERVYMAGYGRKEKSKGVLDPIEINAFALNDGIKDIVFCLIDGIIMEDSVIKPVKNALYKEFLLNEDQIVIGCIHTHSAPAYFKLYFEDTKVELSLRLQLIRQTIGTIKEALSSMQEASCTIDRCTIEGLYGNRNIMNDYSNKNIYSFNFIHEDQPIATIMQMACHPTILDGSNYLLSADLLGWVRKKVQKTNKVPVMIMNGCTGDVSTRFYRQKKGIEELDRVSEEITKQLKNKHSIPYHLGPIRYAQINKSYTFDASNDPWTQKEIAILEKKKQEETDSKLVAYYTQLLRNLKIKCENSPMKLDLTSHIFLSGNVLFITLPGDITAKLGKRLEEAFPQYLVIPVCYCENYSNYFVSEEDYGKYFESYISRMPVGGPDDLIETIIQQTRQMIHEPIIDHSQTDHTTWIRE